MLAYAASHTDQARAQRLAEDAERYARVDTRDWELHDRIHLLNALVNARSWQRAEHVAAEIDTIGGNVKGSRHLARRLIAIREWGRAEQIIAAQTARTAQDSLRRTLATRLAKAGQWRRAEQVAATINTERDRMRARAAIADCLIDAERWDDAQQILASLTSADLRCRGLSRMACCIAGVDLQRARSLLAQFAQPIIDEGHTPVHAADFCRALAITGRWNEAEEVARAIDDPDLKLTAIINIVDTYAQARRWDDAARLANSLTCPHDRVVALTELIPAAAVVAPQQALNFANEVTTATALIVELDEKATAVERLFEALGTAGLIGQAAELARNLSTRSCKAEAMAIVAKATASIDRAHSHRLADEAERLIAAIDQPDLRAQATLRTASIFTDGQLWKHAEHLIDAIKHSNERAWALRRLSVALSKTQQWEEAERVAHSIKHTDQRSVALQHLIVNLSEAFATLDNDNSKQQETRQSVQRLLAHTLTGPDPLEALAAAAEIVPNQVVAICDLFMTEMHSQRI